MLFLAYPKCATCRKAQAFLAEQNAVFTLRHIVQDNPSYEELKQWHAKSGLPLKRFFNTSGLAYKEMNLKDKLPTMTEEEQLSLLASNGMLVKRPLLVGDTFVLVGFREEDWKKVL